MTEFRLSREKCVRGENFPLMMTVGALATYPYRRSEPGASMPMPGGMAPLAGQSLYILFIPG